MPIFVGIEGSIPTVGTIFAGVAHPVERHLAKVEVASSSLVTRSINKLGLFEKFRLGKEKSS